MPAKRQLPAVTEKPDFDTILKRADVMNASFVDRVWLRALIKQEPKHHRKAADFLRQAINNAVERMPSTGAAKEFILLGAEQLRQELSQDGQSRLEKILVDAVVLAWLRLGLVEQGYSCIWDATEGVPLERGLFWEKRLTAAQKRFDAACVSLAKVRKLLRRPANKLSIGQINALVNSSQPTTLGELLPGFTKPLRGARERFADEVKLKSATAAR